MSEESLDWDKEIARLQSYTANLGDFFVREILPKAKFNEYDHLRFMEVSFAVKQADHLKSILELVDSEQYQDAYAISRIMVEGLVILRWAKEEPNVRPHNWRAYVWVAQFKRSYGTPTYDQHKAEFDKALKECRGYLRPASNNKPQEDIKPEDYYDSWRMDDNDDGKFVKVQVKEIFEKVGFGFLHKGMYSPASGWVHWDSISMAEGVKRTPDGGIIYNGADLRYLGATALSAAFHALFATVGMINDDFGLGHTSYFHELYKKYEAKEELIT